MIRKTINLQAIKTELNSRRESLREFERSGAAVRRGEEIIETRLGGAAEGKARRRYIAELETRLAEGEALQAAALGRASRLIEEFHQLGVRQFELFKQINKILLPIRLEVEDEQFVSRKTIIEPAASGNLRLVPRPRGGRER
ncbi:MAG: hypothetical protein HY650_16695 [Acidobacteria bacterium]|nr:hypothetical protein [Acidobacteriota bacterium]